MPPPPIPSGNGKEKQQNKRKQPPQPSIKTNKRAKFIRDARQIVAQTSDKALNNGELDLQAFIKAREFEIKALEDGMQKSKKVLSTRAFQQVPRDMRRRTASHNVKRVPKRLQIRAKKEMLADNTPTVTANKRKPGNTRARLRAETAKKLGFLSEKKKAARAMARETSQGARKDAVAAEEKLAIVTRPARPKVNKNELSAFPKPRSKFRKRQIEKTWLPTHIFHAKRARMTDPKHPLWRFAIPLTPSLKSYRPTHRQSSERGAVCWDMSYISTIGLEGPQKSLEKVLKAIGITKVELWGKRGEKWRSGKRSWTGCLIKEGSTETVYTAPATVLWSPSENSQSVSGNDEEQLQAAQCRVLIRVHPAAFLELWNDVLGISKMQRPIVTVEDLRFEIGSIEITGPGSTETLLGILHPSENDISSKSHAEAFSKLAGVTNAASLPPNAILSLSVSDPRLHHPPRKITLPKPTDEEANFKRLEMLSTWPIDAETGNSAFFYRELRYRATRLPSQKAINRRKALAPPGTYPRRTSTDPDIPITLLASRSPASSLGAQGSWTVLAPWKCILPFWYGFMHYPLSSGGNPSFGGLEEQRQIHFEHGIPWFPGDFPGTKAGWEWEQEERNKRKDTWDRKPKGKRVTWDKVDLGGGRKGEVGVGWSCDFERLAKADVILGSASSDAMDLDLTSPDKTVETSKEDNTEKSDSNPPLPYCSNSSFVSLLRAQNPNPPPPCLATIRISLFTGVAEPCARIYRLPFPSPVTSTSAADTSTTVKSSTNTPVPSLRQQWLSIVPESLKDSKSQPKPKPMPLKQSRLPKTQNQAEFKRAVAQSLFQTPPLPYPAIKPDPSETHPMVPGEEDLIGFVTTGNFNLADGRGVGIGSVVVSKMLESWNIQIDGKGVKDNERKLCIVRNAGTSTGRLGTWEPVGMS